MKKLRLVLLCCMALLAIVVALPAAAQSNPFGLSDDDWALLQTAQTNIPSDYAYTYTSTLSVAQGGTDMAGWDISGSGLVSSAGFSMDNQGTMTTPDGESTAEIYITVVDGSLYVSKNGTDWYSSTLEDLGQQVMTMSGMSGIAGAGGATSSGDMSALMAQPGVMEAMMGLSSLDPSTFTSIERLDDTADGEAHFQTVLDLAVLLNSPELAPVFSAAMGMSAGSSTGMTADQAAQMGGMVTQMLADLGFTVTVDQYVDPTTGQVTGADLSIALSYPNALDASLNLSVQLSSADGQVPEAPASSQPLSELMSSMSGMMSS